MFIVEGVTHNADNGSIEFISLPTLFNKEEDAVDAMCNLYKEQLEKLGLENNDAYDPKTDESCPGGCIELHEAVIYDIAYCAMGCLVEVTAIIIKEVN